MRGFLWILLLVSTQLNAQAPRIICADIAPYCSSENGVSSGLVFDIGKEIVKRIDAKSTIEILPFSRALHAVQTEKRVFSLWLGRTPEREKTVKWIAPLVSDAFYIYTNKDKPVVTTIDQARELGILATFATKTNIQAASNHGLVHIETSSSHISNGKKLLAGRVDGWVTTELIAQHFLSTQKLDGHQLAKGVKLMDFNVYLSASLDTDAETIQKWAETLHAMRQDGSLRGIMLRHQVPERQFSDLR